MGFDNECILNIQSLPGEYFCPVCRTLVYPNEALQSQCTHLYCKPCLAYIVATTQACPYDGYLVTEADSKPLMESNKTLAETVGKVAVHCLYHRSGCQWQGTLSDCITHCTGCSFGNSPVVCNRCGTQIIHRQVQEHAQICPGLQLQAQQVENTQVQASTVATQAAQDQSAGATSAVTIATVASSATPVATATQATSATTSTATVTMAATAATPATPSVSMAAAPAPASVPTANLSSGQGQTQVKAAAYQQAAAQAPTADQWYQQQQLQYQQYYQQYPGYNPYQQYQQYGQYQQAYQQYAQPQMQAASQQVVQGQQQPSPYIMPQPNAQQHPQPQPHPLPQQLSQPQVQPQAQVAQLQSNQQNVQLQPQPQPNAQVQQMQAPQSHVPPQQPLPQTQPPAHPPSGAQVAGQQFGQPLPQPQPHAPAQPVQQLQPPPYQQLLPTQQHPLQQPPNLQPHPQQQPHAQPQLQAQPVAHPQPHFQQHMQLQPHSQPQLNAQVQPQPLPQAQLPQLQPSHPSLHAVTGHQSYQQPQPVHQFPPGAPQQHPIHMHPQQQGIPQHAVKMNNQLVPQQTPQMRPPQGQFPGQVQQQSTMLPPQGPHANIQQPQQQQPHHLVSHHAQMVQQHPGIQSHASQQGLQPQQAHAPLQPGQPYQHGMLPSQPPLQQQQPMRPHGPPYLQQQIPGQSYSQQNAPQGQGLPPAHQAQVVAGRPTLMMNHGMPQQPFQHSPHGPSKYVQPGVTNQQLPMVRSSTHMPTAPELQGAPPHSAGQGALIPTSTASAKPTKDVPEIGKKIIPKNTEGAEKGDANHVEIEGSVYTGSGTLSSGSVREGKAEGEAKEKKSIKDASELAQLVESDEAEALANKPGMKEEVTDPPREGTDSSLPLKDSHRENENKSIEDTPSEKPGAQAEGNDTYAQSDDGKVQSTKPPMPDELGSHMDNTSQSNISQDQEIGNIAGNMQASQQMPAPGGSFPQPVYHSGHPPEFARQGPVSGVVQGMTPSGPIPGHERYPPPYAHPSSMTDTAQRPPGPAQHMQHPGATHERRFQEPPPPYFMHAHRETYPQPPPGQQPYGSFHAEVATRSSGPQVPSHINVGGIRPHGESLIRPAMGGPPPGVFDTTRGPPFGPEDQVGRPRPVNALEAESYAARGPGFSDGRQPEPPFVQSGIAKVNGMVGKGPMHGSSFREERIRSLPEDGFNTVVDENLRPYPVDPSRRNVSRRDFEEDLKQFPRPAHLDGEGLSKFDGYISSSRPLDRAPGRSEGVPGVLPVRPLLPYQSSGPFPSGSAASDQRPMDIGERHRHVGFHEDFGRRPDPISGHPDLLRSGAEFGHHRMDGLPPLRSPGREYGGIPSGRFGLGNQHRFEDFDGREPRGFVERSKGVNFPPDHFLRGIPDGPGSLRNMDRLDLDGPNVPRSHFRPGDRNFPSFLRGGEYLGQGPLRLGDPTGYGGNYSRHGFPNEAGHFSSVSLRGEMDTFEHPRKRIAASMGWCRICRVDCETVEGLDLHSQTREHQKMAMDMIISIKQEVGKKQKLNSDDQASIDDTNKSRKANFENRGNRP